MREAAVHYIDLHVRLDRLCRRFHVSFELRRSELQVDRRVLDQRPLLSALAKLIPVRDGKFLKRFALHVYASGEYVVINA